MIGAFLGLSTFKKILDCLIVAAIVGAGVWIYLALVHRSQQISELKSENAVMLAAAQDNAAAATAAQQSLARTTAALDDANKHAEANAALAGQLKERIANAPKHGCMGPAERALLDGLRTDALNRRSQVPQPVVP